MSSADTGLPTCGPARVPVESPRSCTFCARRNLPHTPPCTASAARSGAGRASAPTPTTRSWSCASRTRWAAPSSGRTPEATSWTSAGRAQRGSRQISRGVAGVVAGSGKGDHIPRSTSGVFGFRLATFPCSDSRQEPPAPPGPRSSSRSGLPDSARLDRVGRSAPARSRRTACRILARSAARGVRRRRFRGRERSRQRHVACEPSPPARHWSWSGSRFRSRTARRARSSRCPCARSPACRSSSPASEGAPGDSSQFRR